ncbi:MAG: hypothetical protein KJ950_06330 [Proteobacteria bacterium]|nr:hypothetical protein [Pseudomonadota bacterium]MBU1687149.1 hypothetical protein [Pseudomonadota bacterium]
MVTGLMGQRIGTMAELTGAARTILNCGDDNYAMKQAVERMYAVLAELTGISAEDMTTGEIILPSGKAISPGAAAHCLLEYKRTAIFLRGIRQAIDTVLSRSASAPVRLLYAGCGPYATLITPLLSRYSPEELQVDLLDVNPASLTAAQKVIETLGLNDFIGDYFCADAAIWQIQDERRYDILLSETMQACLDHEPQVAIMENLVPQLPEKVFIIPESVVIDAKLTDPKQEMDRLFYSEPPKPPPERIELGEVLNLNRGRFVKDERTGEVTIPKNLSTCIELKLFTTVTVFADEVLSEHDSSITMPKKFYEFREPYADKVRFWYDCSNMPKISCAVVASTETSKNSTDVYYAAEKITS